MKAMSWRIFWILTLVIFLVVTTGCGSTTYRTLTEEFNRKDTDILEDKGQDIRGYVLTNGQYHDFKGKVALTADDSLRFWQAPDNSYNRRKDDPGFKLAVADVAGVKVYKSDPAGTVLTVIGVTLFIGVAVLAVAIATKESCPFIYSYDGQQYVFDGEPYGGAIMSSLQRTDASELEHLEPVDGAYRLRLGNEVDETQHTDHLELVTVDHAPGTRAVMDYAGLPHCFAEQAALSAARDEDGRDLMAWLRDDDEVAWYPDLASYAERDVLVDTRNHLTLEFPRPAGRDSVHLVANVGTGQWGSHMIRVMLGMRGNEVGAFYDAVNASEEYQRQLRVWNEREELFLLNVEVQEGEGWARQGTLHGGGPFISERRALPLDLSRIEGDTVRLRIHPPLGFWSLNSFHLAWEETPATVDRPALLSAVDNEGRDVKAVLSATDGATLDFPTTNESAELVFAAPQPQPDRVRTVFARTTGWYEIHLYNDGPPETDNLLRLTHEPGYIVHRALQELAEYRATGVLGYTKPAAAAP